MTSLLLANLRTRLILLVLLALVPLAILILANDAERREVLAQGVENQLEQLVRLAVSTEGRYREGASQLLIALAQSDQVQGENQAACNAYVATLIEQESRYVNISVVERDGTLFCSALSTDRLLNYSDRAWFQRVVATKAFSVGDYEVGRITGIPVLTFAYPVFDEAGDLRRVVQLGLDLEWITDFTQEAQLPPGSTLLVVH